MAHVVQGILFLIPGLNEKSRRYMVTGTHSIEKNFWITQKIIGELFEVDKSVITKYLKNMFTEAELYEKEGEMLLYL
ncbi:hypothetical protein [Sporosarcina limicola]|uniref:Uncharacterized protein n=1 Tax=Sporosarcina limicola TaxID=34101 RepID=A0A927MSK9_9BACL|nr:hypothetical protein [Sporosarcina limicola]MBE1556601.1 hypothetical protein [Sporosarcina limicola]